MESLQRVTRPTILVLKCAYELASHGFWGLQVSKLTGLKTGTVYPILERLEALGWLYSEWELSPERSGPRRRRYFLTQDAREELTSMFSEEIDIASPSDWRLALKTHPAR